MRTLKAVIIRNKTYIEGVRNGNLSRKTFFKDYSHFTF